MKKKKDDRKIIWIRLPYLGNIGDSLKKHCLKEVQKCLKENVRFITSYETKKTAMFCSAKDSIPIQQKANVIYKVTCPGCNEDLNLVTRLNEHTSREDQPMYQHLSECEHFALISDLHRLPDIDASTTQRSVTNSTLLTLLFLTFVFWTHAVTGLNCYFQKHCTSKILHLKLMMA